MAQARNSLSTGGLSSPTRIRSKSTGVQTKDQSGARSDAGQHLSEKFRMVKVVDAKSGATIGMRMTTIKRVYCTEPEPGTVHVSPDSRGDENALQLADIQHRDNPVAQIRGGYDYASITQLAKALDTTMEATINVLGLPRSTIKKKQMDAQPLSPALSDQIYRANRVFVRCIDLFGEKEAANRWLQREHPSLNGVTPLSLLDTTAGYEMVLDELERINNGVPV